MEYRVIESSYKDLAAMSVESETVAAQFLPGSGGKLASLIYKPRGLELLVQKPGQTYRKQPYDGDYVAGECSGCDDMFPTIDACYYQNAPWKGTPIPDHGEVWSLPWDCQMDGNRLHLATHGVRFPYRLEKWAGMAGPAALQIDYRLTNLSAFDMDFMWAAHMMIILQEGAELVLPLGVKQVVNRVSFNGRLGNYGNVLDWPRCTAPDGAVHDLSRPRPHSAHDADKYFVKGKLPEGWCALKLPHSKLTFKVEFPVEQVPYLGVLPNEGGFQDLYNIFLEPCTASFDDLNVAKVRGECSVLRARSTYEWSLRLSVAEGI
ncbi:MAG TPA: hypothetical protein VGK81_01040 [Anaerolineae bacterium]